MLTHVYDWLEICYLSRCRVQGLVRGGNKGGGCRRWGSEVDISLMNTCPEVPCAKGEIEGEVVDVVDDEGVRGFGRAMT